MTIRVAIAGPRGRMGSEAVETIMKQHEMELVATLDYKEVGDKLSDLDIFPNYDNVPIYTNLKNLIYDTKPDVLVDLTTPYSVFEHAREALSLRVRVVIGTTGFTDEQLNELKQIASDYEVGALIVPNFAIGAVLMMKFAQIAAKYLPDVEIIEMHHDQKLDAPSGTAYKTAQMISVEREPHKQGHIDEHETLRGARGANYEGIPIHSVRLPGLVAHQQVLFGGNGELLTLRHDSFNRQSFMHGIVISIEKVMELRQLIYGLEKLI